MSFPVTAGLSYGEEKRVTTTKKMALGTRGVTPDGRVFYYARNGAVALTRGMALQSAVPIAVHQDDLDVQASPAVGDIAVLITVATTPTTRDQYADGYLTIETSPGQGIYKIESHPAVASAAVGVFQLYDNDGLAEALTSGTTKVGLQQNPYASVVAFPTSATNAAAGIAMNDVPISNFCWVQTWGPSIVKLDAITIGTARTISVPGASVGNATPTVSSFNGHLLEQIGITPDVGQGDEDFNYIFLTLRA